MQAPEEQAVSPKAATPVQNGGQADGADSGGFNGPDYDADVCMPMLMCLCVPACVRACARLQHQRIRACVLCLDGFVVHVVIKAPADTQMPACKHLCLSLSPSPSPPPTHTDIRLNARSSTSVSLCHLLSLPACTVSFAASAPILCYSHMLMFLS